MKPKYQQIFNRANVSADDQLVQRLYKLEMKETPFVFPTKFKMMMLIFKERFMQEKWITVPLTFEIYSEFENVDDTDRESVHFAISSAKGACAIFFKHFKKWSMEQEGDYHHDKYKIIQLTDKDISNYPSRNGILKFDSRDSSVDDETRRKEATAIEKSNYDKEDLTSHESKNEITWISYIIENTSELKMLAKKMDMKKMKDLVTEAAKILGEDAKNVKVGMKLKNDMVLYYYPNQESDDISIANFIYAYSEHLQNCNLTGIVFVFAKHNQDKNNNSPVTVWYQLIIPAASNASSSSSSAPPPPRSCPGSNLLRSLWRVAICWRVMLQMPSRQNGMRRTG